jgi:hypothetical protein
MINIDSETLNSILFGLIIAIVIILIVKMIRDNDSSKEQLHYKVGGEQSERRFDDMVNKTPSCNLSNKAQGPSEIESDEEASVDTAEMPVERPVVKNLVQPPKRYCDLNEIEERDHALRRDIVIGRKLQQGDKRDTFDDREIKEYQNQVFRAEDNLNYSSRNTVCSTDRLNEIFTAHNNELTNEKGQTIADVFDGLTKNQLREMAQCKNPGCMLPGGYDELQQRKVYMDAENTTLPTYLNYHTRYETDGVNNGGKFGDMDISGHDNTLSGHMALI